MSPVHQSAGLDRRRFPALPWSLRETRHNPNDLGLTETLFCVGNGYLGLRDNPPEGRVAHQHGTFIRLPRDVANPPCGNCSWVRHDWPDDCQRAGRQAHEVVRG